jgi:hypothetical protein
MAVDMSLSKPNLLSRGLTRTKIMSKIMPIARAALMGLAAAGLVVSTAQAQASAAKPTRADRPCFSLSDWHGWSSPDSKTMYLKVRNRDVYRLDLTHGSNQLNWPGSHLVTVVRGSDRICNPIDLDLRVSDGFGMAIPIRAKTITKLTPDEIAAIPKKDRP